jgi:hypothetical protein
VLAATALDFYNEAAAVLGLPQNSTYAQARAFPSSIEYPFSFHLIAVVRRGRLPQALSDRSIR